MFAEHNPAILELVCARQLAPEADVQAALAAVAGSGGASFAAQLIDAGVVEREALLAALATELGFGCVARVPAELPADLVAELDEVVARRLRVVPLARDGGRLVVAAVDPFAPDLAADLRFARADATPAVADPERVERLWRRYYGDAVDGVGRDADAGVVTATEGAALTDRDLEQMAGQEAVVRFVNSVLAQAIRERASDLHFEPFEDEFRVRCRVDGALRDLPSPGRALALPVSSRLKVLANVNIAERRVPQDGRIRLTLEGRAVDLRLSTLPTQFGESVVLRVLDQSTGRLDFAQLHLPAAIHEGLSAAIAKPNGIVVVTGPTGSGKTTTLYSCLKGLNVTGAKLLTIEDPVEYEIEGVMQVAVNPAAGLGFPQALRSFLRQDPDVVMVGEIRDAETAQIAIQAALTGHLVLTTLHTNDAPSAVTRLIDMGVEPFLIASTLEAVLAQRLLRRICRACCEPHVSSAAMLAQLESAKPADSLMREFSRGRGCAACQHTGYRGRVGIFEFMPVTDPLRDAIAGGISLLELKQRSAAAGMTTLRDAALATLKSGETTVEEVLKYT